MKTFILILLFVFGLNAFATPVELTVQSVAETAATANLQAVSAPSGNKFSNQQENVLLIVQNQSVSDAATVTVTAQSTSIIDSILGVVSKANQAITLAAGAVKILGPFPKRTFNTSSGYVEFVTAGTGSSSVYALPVYSPQLLKQR